MKYEVRGEILGFPDTLNVEITEIDEMFSTMNDLANEHISFTLVNPYILREYSFDVPSDVKILLEISDESQMSVYNLLVVQKPLDQSVINFLAPIVINHDNNKLAQIILDPIKYQDFDVAETIASFRPKT